MQLTGLHHLTAVTAQAARNHKFYTDTLGMRLVKKTVNQDDVSAYHLFYADGLASPGSDLTFFDWPVGSRTARHAFDHRAPGFVSPAKRRSTGGSSASRTSASRISRRSSAMDASPSTSRISKASA